MINFIITMEIILVIGLGLVAFIDRKLEKAIKEYEVEKRRSRFKVIEGNQRKVGVK